MKSILSIVTMLGLAACTACPPLEERPVLAACVIGELPAPDGGVRRASFSGRVAAVGSQLAMPCEEGWSIGDTAAAQASDAEVTWLAIRPEVGVEPLRLGMWAEGLQDPLGGNRDTWTVEVRLVEGGASYLEVRDEDGRVTFFLGRAASVDRLDHPTELIVEEGQPVCRGEGSCGPVRGVTLEVEADGERAELRPHEQMVRTTESLWFNDTTQVIVHGGYDRPTDDEACPDDAQLTVAWWEAEE